MKEASSFMWELVGLLRKHGHDVGLTPAKVDLREIKVEVEEVTASDPVLSVTLSWEEKS